MHQHSSSSNTKPTISAQDAGKVSELSKLVLDNKDYFTHLCLPAKLWVLYPLGKANIFNCPNKWEKMSAGILRHDIMEKIHCFALVKITAILSNNTEKTVESYWIIKTCLFCKDEQSCGDDRILFVMVSANKIECSSPFLFWHSLLLRYLTLQTKIYMSYVSKWKLFWSKSEKTLLFQSKWGAAIKHPPNTQLISVFKCKLQIQAANGSAYRQIIQTLLTKKSGKDLLKNA